MKMFKLKLVWIIAAALAFGAWPSAAQESDSNLALARRLNQAFVDVAQKVSPSVVVLNVIQKLQPASDDEQDNGTYESLPPGFWKNFHEQFKRDVPEKMLSEGSGVIIRKNGYILTNRHVIEDAERIDVRLVDGRSFKATVRGFDPQSDVAVLKIDATNLPVATLADSSKTRVGEFAIAIGAPYSLDNSVTFGHVSALMRSQVIEGFEGAAMDQEFIQTDTLINPGNSGGPLVNIEGEVIGINTLIRGLHTGIGFAIPSNLAKEVSDQLIATGKFRRAWLGIGIRALRDDPDLRALVKSVDEGVIVSAIMPNGPAAKSELKPSDIITAVDGTKVATPQQLRTAIRGKSIGEPVTLDVCRKDKLVKVSVRPAEYEQQPVIAVAKAKTGPTPAKPQPVGLTVQALTSELASKFGVKATEGVLVAGVEKNSIAERRGFRPGDVITSLDQRPVTTPKQFNEALKKADLKQGVLINLLSGSTARFEVLKQE